MIIIIIIIIIYFLLDPKVSEFSLFSDYLKNTLHFSEFSSAEHNIGAESILINFEHTPYAVLAKSRNQFISEYI